MADPDDWEDEEEAGVAPDLTVYPDETEPEPVLYLGDGTPLYRYRDPFGFARPQQPERIPRPRRKAKAIRRRRTR